MPSDVSTSFCDKLCATFGECHLSVPSETRALTKDELAAYFEVEVMDLWEERWPMVVARWCSAPWCHEVLLSGALCRKHGGRWPCWSFDRESSVHGKPIGYFRIRVTNVKNQARRYALYHQTVKMAPPGHAVHHVDFNKWNNRSANLAVLTHAEHLAVHFPSINR